jgi:hypothetical protein
MSSTDVDVSSGKMGREQPHLCMASSEGGITPPLTHVTTRDEDPAGRGHGCGHGGKNARLPRFSASCPSWLSALALTGGLSFTPLPVLPYQRDIDQPLMRIGGFPASGCAT